MITLPLQLEQQINHIATMEHIAPETVLERAMQSFIDNLEDKADIQAADKAKSELLSGDDYAISLDEFMGRMNAVDD
ncbi:MAG: hypothetical protein PHQ03_07440 [Methylococcales bacterium]|nr:hypothetical protein [Methylococcales bacterium]